MLWFHNLSCTIFDKKNDKKQNERKSWELTVYITYLNVAKQEGERGYTMYIVHFSTLLLWNIMFGDHKSIRFWLYIFLFVWWQVLENCKIWIIMGLINYKMSPNFSWPDMIVYLLTYIFAKYSIFLFRQTTMYITNFPSLSLKFHKWTVSNLHGQLGQDFQSLLLG